MTRFHARAASIAAFLIGFGLGAWYGSARTLRRIRFFSDPANREKAGRAKHERFDEPS